jgi:hypothetical protein
LPTRSSPVELENLAVIAADDQQRGRANECQRGPREIRAAAARDDGANVRIGDIEGDHPRATFVQGFEGKECGVPVLTGHYWLQTLSTAHALVAFDISDAEHPREISRVTLRSDEAPHWIAIDATGRRVVLNSGGKGSRLFVIDFNPANGRLALLSASGIPAPRAPASASAASSGQDLRAS